jgi:hypothetical protein
VFREQNEKWLDEDDEVQRGQVSSGMICKTERCSLMSQISIFIAMFKLVLQ